MRDQETARDLQVETPDGRTLGVSLWGDPDGAQLFWLHGTPGSRRLRHDVNEYRANRLWVCTYDRPGYGVSTRRPGRTVAQVADDVRTIADALGWDRFGAAGVSGGGAPALATAAGLADRVTRCAAVVVPGPATAPDLDFLAGMDEEARESWDKALRHDTAALEAEWDEAVAWFADGMPGIDVSDQVRTMLGETLDAAGSHGVGGFVDDPLGLPSIHPDNRLPRKPEAKAEAAATSRFWSVTAPAGTQLPERARVVVIGGGVIGCSVAYHLAHAGWTDVVLLERDRLTSGTTWHAAGLMTCFGSTSETSTAIRMYSRDLYARLEEETGQATGFKPVGLIEAAADSARLEEYRRVAAFQRHLGLEVEEISPREMADLFPWAKTDDLVAGFHVPGDGRVNPVDVTTALAKGARQLGVRIIEGVSVEDVLTDRGRVTGVRVSAGGAGETTEIEVEYVVNCAGMWARELGARNGLVIPNQAAEHYYLITDTIDGLDPDAPVFEDPASYGYYREEGGGMMVGLFEPQAAPWNVEGVPRDFSFGKIRPDWDRMGPFLEKAMARVPVTLEVGVRTFFCGPESFTPDLAPAVGEAPGIRNYFVAAGMNSVGILSAGGLGRVLAHWITVGRPDVDVTGFNVDRFRPWQADDSYRAARTTEILGTVYAAHTPGMQLRTARNTLLSPVHDRLVEQGGYLREVSGWEGADWFGGLGTTPAAEPTWGRAPWFEQWEAEHRAVREGVGLMDMSFMAKFRVQGLDAGEMLDRVSAGAVNEMAETITYTQWLDEDGRIEGDLTVTKLGEGDFFVVASDTAHGHTSAWLARHAGDADCTVTDVTADYGQLNVQGPLSREVLAGLTAADLSTDVFGFRTARWLELAGVETLCVRITYLGELGYELYVPAADTLLVYDALQAAGAAYGLRPVGLKALASLRMEKAYRDFGHDIDNTDCPLEAGLGFALALDKPGGFVGRDAVLARKSANAAAGGLGQRILQIRVLDPDPLLFHAEVLHRDGEAVGYVRAASYGWTLGGAVGLAMVSGGGQPVTPDWLEAGTWQVDVAGIRYPVEVSLRPMYDPTSARIKA